MSSNVAAFSDSTSSTVVQNSLKWKTTYFDNVTHTADNSETDFWFNPESVIPDIGDAAFAPASYIDSVEIKTLPTFVTPSGTLDALSAYGAIGLSVVETPADSLSNPQNHLCVGSESTRITTTTDPRWVHVFSFNYNKARNEGFELTTQYVNSTMYFLLAKLAFIHLNTGNSVKAHSFPVQITVHGRTEVAPRSTVGQALVPGTSWSTPTTVAGTGLHPAVTSITNLVKELQ